MSDSTPAPSVAVSVSVAVPVPVAVSLLDLGWRAPFARAMELLTDATLVPGRIVLQQRGRYAVAMSTGEIAAALGERFRKAATSAAELPCVGDWVAVRAPGADAELGAVAALLPRITKLSRRAAGPEPAEQVLAANVDTIFIAMGLDGDFNLHRLARYIAVAGASGGRPVVLLTKADLCVDAAALAARIAAVEEIAPGVTVVTTSVVIGGAGIGAVDPFLTRGQTVAMLGSSGVGKSTLVNALLGQDLLRTGEVRASDSQGRHTTTQRQLFRIRGGAMVIDTPGIRDLQLWDTDDGSSGSSGAPGGVAEVVEVSGPRCHFRDCRHLAEPGCEVRAARARGQLPAEKGTASSGQIKSGRKADRRRDR